MSEDGRSRFSHGGGDGAIGCDVTALVGEGPEEFSDGLGGESSQLVGFAEETRQERLSGGGVFPGDFAVGCELADE